MADQSQPFSFSQEEIMGSSTNGRVQRSSAEWASLLSRYEAGGRSLAAFCRAEGIARSTFDLWRRKMGRTKSAVKKTPEKPSADFIEMQPSVDRIGGWTFEIELPDGTVARVQG